MTPHQGRRIVRRPSCEVFLSGSRKMWRGYWSGISLSVVLLVAAAWLIAQHQQSVQRQPFKLNESSLAAFRSLEPIDAHTHIYQDNPDLIAMLQRLHLHVLTILYVDDHISYLKAMEPQRSDASKFVASSMGHAQLCTTFDPYQFSHHDFPAVAINGLNQDFAGGAVAAKIWKNLGMEIVNSSGKHIMPDHPRFAPIYQDIAAHGKSLIIHAADPDEAWAPNSAGSSEYYKMNPQWDMRQKANAPSKVDILNAGDHVLAMNPNLRVVGAHLGSMEDHLDNLAARLDRYPNFAVDTAARVGNLEVQPHDKVRAFILQYQDRILYGTDLRLDMGTIGPPALETWERLYAANWRYFGTDDTFEYSGHRVQGLNLPRSVLKKLYHDNAIRWIPGIDGSLHRETQTSSGVRAPGEKHKTCHRQLRAILAQAHIR